MQSVSYVWRKRIKPHPIYLQNVLRFAMLRQNVLGSPFLVQPLVWSVKQLSSFLREAHIGLCEDLVHMDG